MVHLIAIESQPLPARWPAKCLSQLSVARQAPQKVAVSSLAPIDELVIVDSRRRQVVVAGQEVLTADRVRGTGADIAASDES